MPLNTFTKIFKVAGVAGVQVVAVMGSVYRSTLVLVRVCVSAVLVPLLQARALLPR